MWVLKIKAVSSYPALPARATPALFAPSASASTHLTLTGQGVVNNFKILFKSVHKHTHEEIQHAQLNPNMRLTQMPIKKQGPKCVCPQSRAWDVIVFSFRLRDCLMRFFTPFRSLRASSAWCFYSFIVCRRLSTSTVRLLGGQGTEVGETMKERR